MMNDNTPIQLPQDWEDVRPGFPVVDEGVYTVRVVGLQGQDGQQVKAEFQILDKGLFRNHRLFQTYTLGTDAGKRALKELVQVLGVATADRTLDPAACLQKTLGVTVRHNRKDGKVYANIVAHHPTDAVRGTE